MNNKFKLILYTEINGRLYHVEEMDEYSNSAATLIKEAHHIIRDIKELGIMEGFTIEIWKNDSKGIYSKPYWTKKVKANASNVKEHKGENKMKVTIVENEQDNTDKIIDTLGIDKADRLMYLYNNAYQSGTEYDKTFKTGFHKSKDEIFRLKARREKFTDDEIDLFLQYGPNS